MVMFDRAPKSPALFGRPRERRSYHWATVSGMSRADDEILLAAPFHKHHVLARDDFERRWSVPANCTVTIDRSDSPPKKDASREVDPAGRVATD